MNILRIVRYTLTVFVIVIVFVIVCIIVCDQLVVRNAKGKLYSNAEAIPQREVGLLLGTSPQSRFGGPNQFYIYRVDAAAELYHARKIRKILISGSDNSLNGVNEVENMRDSLVARGVRAEDMILDGKGYRTFSSIDHVFNQYGYSSFTIISQRFHNERALYQAEHMNLEIDSVIAYNAPDATSKLAFITYLREYLARVKMFLDLLF